VKQLLKKFFQPKKLKFKSKRDKITLYKNDHQILSVFIKDDGSIGLSIYGDLDISIIGEINIISSKNISIDSIGSKLFFNSKMSKQIRDLPTSIEYRKQQILKVLKMKKKVKDATPVLENINDEPSPENKKIIQKLHKKQNELLDTIIDSPNQGE